MEKSRTVNSNLDGLPFQSASSKKYIVENSAFKKKNKPTTEKSQEDIIHSLQSFFCKGRYRTWALKQVKGS
jgi:hypothetical protein